MEIDGVACFIGAILICTAHVLYIRNWRREQRQMQSWWRAHDAASQARHEEFMRVMARTDDNN